MKPAQWLLAGALIAGGVWVAAEEPKPTGLTERVEKRLVQLDVAVQGDPDAIRRLTAKDFALYVGEHQVEGLIVDPLCGEESPTPATQGERPTEGPAPVVAPNSAKPRATFVFFFDQTHLTTAGRALSLETARDLIKRLIVDGARASIVSNARSLETFVPMTDDREQLLEGLSRLRNDPKQWESYAELENNVGPRSSSRVRSRADVVDSLGRPVAPCPLLGKIRANEELLEARRSLERLRITVGALVDVPAPRGLVYFGDNLREKAGLHYLNLYCPGSAATLSAEMVPSAAAEFDAVTAEATARGIHFFTVQAEGLLAYFPGWDTERHRHAQDTLVGLAAETGGEAFLGGASNKFIADRIETLTSCRLLLSFPPGDLPHDKAMNVTLQLHVPGIKIQTQGRIVVASPESIERARLLAAFVDPASSDDGSLRALLIPRGSDGKTWTVAVQLRLRSTGLPDNSAELGASIVRRDKVTDHFAASIATKSASRAMVLEKRIELDPGAFSIVAVARDAKRGDIGSSRLRAEWPNPAKTDAAIAPVAVLQAGPAAMSKDGAVSSSGLLAREVDEPLDPSASVTLESVVCRGAKSHGPVVIERWLEDGSANDFSPMTIAETDGPCVQTIDVVPAGRLQSGVADYRIVARIGDEIVAQERRTLRVGTTP